jgi:hypothetical protein
VSGSIGYKLNTAPVVMAPYAAVADVDSRNFAGGELRVTIVSASDAANRLETSGPFTVSKGRVLYSSNVIGTLASNGVGTNALVIKFYSRATPNVVQQLVRSLTFRTVGTSLVMNRSISFQLTDGDGGTSAAQYKTIQTTSAETDRTWY